MRLLLFLAKSFFSQQLSVIMLHFEYFKCFVDFCYEQAWGVSSQWLKLLLISHWDTKQCLYLQFFAL